MAADTNSIDITATAEGMDIKLLTIPVENQKSDKESTTGKGFIGFSWVCGTKGHKAVKCHDEKGLNNDNDKYDDGIMSGDADEVDHGIRSSCNLEGSDVLCSNQPDFLGQATSDQ